MKTPKIALSTVLIIGLWCGSTPAASTDHRQYVTGPYTDGPSVTRDCISCHEEAAQAVLHCAHWLWQGPSPFVLGHEEDTHLGKRNLLNNF